MACMPFSDLFSNRSIINESYKASRSLTLFRWDAATAAPLMLVFLFDNKYMNKISDDNLIYILRTKCVSGSVLEVINFVCNEFIVSKQIAKKMIQEDSVLVHFGTDEKEVIEYAEHCKKFGLLTKYKLEEDPYYCDDE